MKNYLKIVNAVQPNPEKCMSETELLAFAHFLALPKKFEYFRFSPKGRAIVRKQFKELGYAHTNSSLNGKIRGLVNKDYLKREEDSVISVRQPIRDIANNIMNAPDRYNIMISFEFENEEAQASIQQHRITTPQVD